MLRKVDEKGRKTKRKRKSERKRKRRRKRRIKRKAEREREEERCAMAKTENCVEVALTKQETTRMDL